MIDELLAKDDEHTIRRKISDYVLMQHQLLPRQPKQVKVEPEVILPKANPQVFTLADLEKAYNDGYKNGIMNEAGLECEPFDVWYNWVHVIKSKNRSEA